MSEQKKPEAGEWWLSNDGTDGPLFIVGRTASGAIVFQSYKNCEPIVDCSEWHDYHHEPDCDSFDWQPETFPQWYVKDDKTPFSDCDHLVRTSKTKVHGINGDGSKTQTVVWCKWHDELVARGEWTQITQAEAEARVKKPEPVESPDDWVTQDRVPARITDQGWYEYDHYNGRVAKRFWNIREQSKNVGRMHGCRIDLGGDMATFEVRCRRRDLPVVPQETPKREYVRLFSHLTSQLVFVSPQDASVHPEYYAELKHDGTGFYLEDCK